ncbi:MAG: aminoacetone oxidase family FAD-binding enzyme [Lachnospiraceae bacterium]|nr:aminoacetone oxidase family FAD-binding enzyme [Lachnospiraceae bacterium]
MESRTKVGVIGAGAAGMAAAVTAAKYGAEVTLFEKNDRVGKKILATGNGRCNMGNLEFSEEKYYCQDREKLHSLFQVFSVWDTMSFFESMGLMIKSKEGYLYPYSEQASAVLDVLRMELDRKKIHVITEGEIKKAAYNADRMTFTLKDIKGKEYECDKLIVACGSPASLKKGEGMTGYALAEKFGHRVKEIVPGLVSLKSHEDFTKALSGVRVKAGVRLVVAGETAGRDVGEVQFTDYGISGIPVFQLSRTAAYALKEGKSVEAVVDFFPDQDEKTFTYMGRLRYEAQQDKSMEDYLTGMLHKKINMVLIKMAGLKPAMTAREAGWEKVKALMELGRNFGIAVSDVNSMDNAQVCAGGVDFSQLNTELESELVKGLYFAGEVVDVDGICGGYNLQWAWTSGYIAGRNAAGSSTRQIALGQEKYKELPEDKS